MPTPSHRPSSVAGVLLLASILLAAGCGSSSATESSPLRPLRTVETAPVVRSERPLPIRTSGHLAQKSERALSFKVGGLIERVVVDEGDRVRAGQTLAVLDPREIDAQVLQARSGLAKAERDLARAERLQADSVATLEEVQDARTGVEIAQAQLEIAAFNQQHAVIAAPAGGRILQRLAEPNELAQPGQPVLVLGTAADGWVVRAGLADRDVVLLAVGDAAEVRFDAFPRRTFGGRVTQIAEAAGAATGTFEVEMTVDDPEGQLKSGFVANVDIFPSMTARYALIPADAFVSGDGDTGIVFGLAAEDGSGAPAVGVPVVQRLPIRIDALVGDQLAVGTGLDGIAHVVTAGASYLADGDSVRVTDDE